MTQTHQVKRSKSPKPLTTGVIARILGVAPRTVSGWCNSGALKHWRIPEGLDRRVEVHQLVEFLRHRNIPVPSEVQALVPPDRLLLVGPTVPLLNAFEGALKVDEDTFGGRPVDIADDAFEAGLLLRGVHDLVIIDGCVGLSVSNQIAEEAMKTPGAQVVIVIPEDASDVMFPIGVSVHHPVSVAALMRAVSEAPA